MEITDPVILKTEKFGSRSETMNKDVDCRKVKYMDGKWIILKTKSKDKGEWSK